MKKYIVNTLFILFLILFFGFIQIKTIYPALTSPLSETIHSSFDNIFVEYSYFNNNKVKSIFIKGKPRSTSVEDRNFRVKQVSALNILDYFKFLNF